MKNKIDLLEKTIVNLDKAMLHYDNALSAIAGAAVARSEGATIVNLLTLKKQYLEELEALTVSSPKGKTKGLNKENN